MKQENIILEKSFVFAVRIVKLYKYLCDEKREYVLSKVANSGYEVNFPRKQLLRCETRKAKVNCFTLVGLEPEILCLA